MSLLQGLAATSARIEAAANGLSEGQLVRSPAPGEWSANEILWHIRATADVYGEQIERILKEDTPAWRHASPRARMKKPRYDELPFIASFAAFQSQRSDLLAQLAALMPEAWQRSAIVRVEKREQRLTLQERIWGMVNHEEIHCGELERIAQAIDLEGKNDGRRPPTSASGPAL